MLVVAMSRVLVAGLLVLLGASVASASAFETALARFSSDSFSETETAIGEIVASGSPRAPAVLQALGSAKLFFDPASKAVYFRDAAGALFDAASGKPVAAAPPDLATVRVNNRLRRTIEAALGSLTLLSPDPKTRLAAAQSIVNSKDPASLPALENALKSEQDLAIKATLLVARAAILLNKDDAPKADRLDAIAALASQGDRAAVGTLTAALGTLTDPDLKHAADAALASLSRRLQITAQVQNAWYGLSLGSVLLLTAIGLAITFGVMGVINMAHGEMVMLGAYTTFMVQELFRAHAPGWLDLSLPIAIPAAFLIAGAVGVVIERGIISHLYGRPLETLLATWGVSLVLQQGVRSLFGASNREVSAPSYMTGSFQIMHVEITYGRLWIVVFTTLLFLALLAVLKLTPLGLRMRAVTQNRRMAAAMGIRTPMIDAMTFGLGSGIAGIAGVALSQIDNVSPNLGQSYIIDSFMVVVFGGVGNLWGTFASAMTLGVANKFLEPVAGAVLAKILILVLLILFIQKRPRGLFALKGRAVDA